MAMQPVGQIKLDEKPIRSGMEVPRSKLVRRLSRAEGESGGYVLPVQRIAMVRAPLRFFMEGHGRFSRALDNSSVGGSAREAPSGHKHIGQS